MGDTSSQHVYKAKFGDIHAQNANRRQNRPWDLRFYEDCPHRYADPRCRRLWHSQTSSAAGRSELAS